MSWDTDCISVLPINVQNELYEDFSPEKLCEALSDRIIELENIIRELEE